MIAIGSDHAGYELKEEIKKHLDVLKIEYRDFGTYGAEPVDYPVYAEKVGESVSKGESVEGILVCGTGIGVSIAANKIKGVRAALCFDEGYAELSRKHNDANVLCIGGRRTDRATAIKIVDKFMNTEFEGGRHKNRVEEISEIEDKN